MKAQATLSGGTAVIVLSALICMGLAWFPTQSLFATLIGLIIGVIIGVGLVSLSEPNTEEIGWAIFGGLVGGGGGWILYDSLVPFLIGIAVGIAGAYALYALLNGFVVFGFTEFDSNSKRGPGGI